MKNGGEEAFGSSDWWSATYGAALDIFGLQVAAGVGTDHLGDQDHQFMTAGIGYGYGPVNTSITYAWIWDSNNDFSEPRLTTESLRANSVLRPTTPWRPVWRYRVTCRLFDNDTNGQLRRRHRRHGLGGLGPLLILGRVSPGRRGGPRDAWAPPAGPEAEATTPATASPAATGLRRWPAEAA